MATEPSGGASPTTGGPAPLPGPFVHCWQADLLTDHPGWPAALASLSAAEQARQTRLRTPALRMRYGRAHGFLRAVLSRYTGLAASQLVFGTELRDKPILRPAGVQFNLSYRAGRALLAVSDRYPVGADIEPLAPLADAAALVAQLFSAPEQAALRAASPAAWWPLFYLIWTRKEAHAKALGMGLSLPFAAFSVLTAPAALVSPGGSQLHSFAAGPGYQAAVAIRTSRPALAMRHFTYHPA